MKPNTTYWHAEAEALQAADDDEGLLRFLLQVLEQLPDDFLLLYSIGITHGNLSHHAEAVEFLDQALAIQTTGHHAAKAYNSRGNALKRLDRLPEATQSWESAVRAHPKVSGSILYNHACGQALAGNADTALTYLDLAIFRDAAYAPMAIDDSDFRSILQHPSFAALTSPAPKSVELSAVTSLLKSPYLTLQLRGMRSAAKLAPQLAPIPRAWIESAFHLLLHFGRPDLADLDWPYWLLREQNEQLLGVARKRKETHTIQFVNDLYLEFLNGLVGPAQFQAITGRISTLESWIKKSGARDRYAAALDALLQRFLSMPATTKVDTQLARHIDDVLQLRSNLIGERDMLLARALRPSFVALLARQPISYYIQTEEAFYIASLVRGELATAFVARFEAVIAVHAQLHTAAEREASTKHAGLLLRFLQLREADEPLIHQRILPMAEHSEWAPAILAACCVAADEDRYDMPDILEKGLVFTLVQTIRVQLPELEALGKWDLILERARRDREKYD